MCKVVLILLGVIALSLVGGHAAGLLTVGVDGQPIHQWAADWIGKKPATTQTPRWTAVQEEEVIGARIEGWKADILQGEAKIKHASQRLVSDLDRRRQAREAQERENLHVAKLARDVAGVECTLADIERTSPENWMLMGELHKNGDGKVQIRLKPTDKVGE